MSRPTAVTDIGWLYIVFGILRLVSALFGLAISLVMSYLPTSVVQSYLQGIGSLWLWANIVPAKTTVTRATTRAVRMWDLIVLGLIHASTAARERQQKVSIASED